MIDGQDLNKAICGDSGPDNDLERGNVFRLRLLYGPRGHPGDRRHPGGDGITVVDGIPAVDGYVSAILQCSSYYDYEAV